MSKHVHTYVASHIVFIWHKKSCATVSTPRKFYTAVYMWNVVQVQSNHVCEISFCVERKSIENSEGI